MTGRGKSSHFVYQRIHVQGGRAAHLSDHLAIAARACEHIYGVRPEIDERAVAARIAEVTRGGYRAARAAGSAAVILRVYDTGEEGDGGSGGFEVEYDRPLLEEGYSISALRPRAWSYDYAIPFGGFPTGFQLAARELFDTLALREHGAGRSVRREGERLIACGDAPLFGIRGRVLFTAPLTAGAVDSVERRLVMAAAGEGAGAGAGAGEGAGEGSGAGRAAAGARLSVREEPILHSELRSFDELFFADAAGITSLSECDDARFMSLVAPRLLAALAAFAELRRK